MGVIAIIGIVLEVLTLLAKVPDLIKQFQDIFGKLQTLRPLQVKGELERLKAAVEAKHAQLDLDQVETGECPLVAYQCDLSSRFEALA